MRWSKRFVGIKSLHVCRLLHDVTMSAPAAADIDAENAAADADLLSQLVQGCSADSWFASARNTADLDT